MDKKIIARNQFLILIFASTLLVFNCQNRTNNFKKIPLDFNQITYFDSEILILFKKKQSWGSGFLYLFERDKLSLIDSAFIPFTPMNQRFENKAFYMEKIIINEEDLERFEKSDMKLGHYDLVLKDRESNPTGGIADFYSQKYIYSDVTYKKEKNLLVFEIQGDSTNRERYLCTK